MNLDLPKLEEKGTLYEKWLADPKAASCKVQRTDLTLDDLDTDFEWSNTFSVREVPAGPSHARMTELGLPLRQYHHMSLRKYVGQDVEILWEGSVQDGVLFVENIAREKDADGPFISELSVAAYKHVHGSMDGLKYVFVTSIINKETKPLITQLCDKQQANLAKSFEMGTQAYHYLLGSEIGRTVASALLGGFDRGTVKIPRITVWWSGRGISRHAQVQFDIEHIN